MTPSKLNFLDQNRLVSLKEEKKLRKPMIEKMRRDRMNSSIEQLKHLLEKQLQSQQTGSKLEKADVLETAVSYLEHQNRLQRAGSASKEVDFREGYARCLQEVSRFLLLQKVHPQTQKKLMCHFQHTHRPGSESLGPSAAKDLPSLWRPWTEESNR